MLDAADFIWYHGGSTWIVLGVRVKWSYLQIIMSEGSLWTFYFIFLFIFQELHPDKLFHGRFLLNFYEKLFFLKNGHVIYHYSQNIIQILEILTDNKSFCHLSVQIKY